MGLCGNRKHSQSAPMTLGDIERELNILKDQIITKGKKLKDSEQQSLFCRIRCSLAQPIDSERSNVKNSQTIKLLTILADTIWKCEIALREKSLGSNPVSIVAL